jgi:hypothetical protein
MAGSLGSSGSVANHHRAEAAGKSAGEQQRAGAGLPAWRGVEIDERICAEHVAEAPEVRGEKPLLWHGQHGYEPGPSGEVDVVRQDTDEFVTRNACLSKCRTHGGERRPVVPVVRHGLRVIVSAAQVATVRINIRDWMNAAVPAGGAKTLLWIVCV